MMKKKPTILGIFRESWVLPKRKVFKFVFVHKADLFDGHIAYCRVRRSNNNSPYSPVSAAEYFDQAVEVEVPTGLSMRVYYTPSTLAGAKGTVMICHHGAGFSGRSFAQFAKEVKLLSRGECGVLSLDAREHGMKHVLVDEQLNRIDRIQLIGKTRTLNDRDLDLSIETLCTDLVELLRVIFPTPSEAPGLLVNPIILS